MQNLLKQPVEVLQLGTSTTNALHRAGIKTVDDLCNTTLREVRRFKDIGANSIAKICEALDRHGLSFKSEFKDIIPVSEDMSLSGLSKVCPSFPEKAANAFQRAGVLTVGKLSDMSEAEMTSLPHIGSCYAEMAVETLSRIKIVAEPLKTTADEERIPRKLWLTDTELAKVTAYIEGLRRQK